MNHSKRFLFRLRSRFPIRRNRNEGGPRGEGFGCCRGIDFDALLFACDDSRHARVFCYRLKSAEAISRTWKTSGLVGKTIRNAFLSRSTI